MKKILIIFLILTVTSITNATTVWTITAEPMSPAYKITVSVTDNPQDVFLALAVDSDGILSDFAAGPNAPEDTWQCGTLADNVYGLDFSDLGQGEMWSMLDFQAPIVYDDGDWLTADFAFAPGSSSSVVSLYQIDVTTGAESFLISHTMVPEPVTLSLLGLGGLFLRRRK